MATKDMPLMLDNHIPINLDDVGDVDDLFGDAGELPLQPFNTQMEKRMDKLRNRGCCQTVAWSRVGTIASISSGGQELELRVLCCRPSNGEWELSEPIVCSLVRGTPEDPLVHLEWAATNNPELAIFDASGRVAILIFSTSLTHPFLVRKWDPDLSSSQPPQPIAGCFWLPVAQQVANSSATAPAAASRPSYNIMFGPAVKNANGTYRYESSFVPADGPSHPLQARPSLLTVTESGVLRMFWMQTKNRTEDTALELDGFGSTCHSITHAALASEKKHLILVLITSSKQLKFVKINIQWDASAAATTAAPQNAGLKVALEQSHTTETTLVQDGGEDGSIPEISHLMALPSIHDPTGSSMVPAMIVAARSRSPNAASFPLPLTVIDRWEVIEQRNGLHPAVEQLADKRNSISSDTLTSTRLQKADPIIISKCAIGMQSSNFGKVVIINFADGTVEHRDRFTFKELFTDQDLTNVTNLRQVGWVFENQGSCQQAAFSPTLCSMVQIGDDERMRWVKLCYPHEELRNTTTSNPQYAATVAGLIVTVAPSIKYQTNFDDMLAMIRPHASNRQLMQDWVRELIRTVKVQVDYSGEHTHDALMKNDQIHSCLSIVHSFGFNGDMAPRSFQSTFALLTAAIRNQAWNLTLAMNPHILFGGKKTPLDDHEVVSSLVNSVKWCQDLFAWITDSLFDLLKDPKFMNILETTRGNDVSSYLQEKNHVALQLLLCSISRGYLVALCRRVAHLDSRSKKVIELFRWQSVAGEPGTPGTPSASHLQVAYQRLQRVTSSSLVSVKRFDELVTQLGQGILQAYDSLLPTMIRKQQNPPPPGKAEDEAVKSARATLETIMLLSVAPHPSLFQVLKKLFLQFIPAFRMTVDPAALFFEDFEILGVNDDDDKMADDAGGAKDTQLSVFTRAKMHLPSTEQFRRCTRCTSVMEELVTKSPGLTFMSSQQRRCPCSGTWAVMPHEN